MIGDYGFEQEVMERTEKYEASVLSVVSCWKSQWFGCGRRPRGD
jgi:hypothetical protein